MAHKLSGLEGTSHTTVRHGDATARPVRLPDSACSAWNDPATVARIAGVALPDVSPAAHNLAHPLPVPGCPWCPAVPCPCGSPSCAQVAEHRRARAGTEQSWREVAA